MPGMFALAAALTAVAVLANWWSRWVGDRRGHSVERISKPAATIGTILMAATAGGGRGVTVAALVALVLCLVGDIALLPDVDRFLLGLVAFLGGHLAFAVMLAMAGLHHGALAGIGLIVVGAIGGVVAAPILRGAARQHLGVPVAVYLAVISTMAVLGWATGNWLFLVGGTAFVVSDAILGSGRFVAERRWTPLAVMVTYHLAIVALAAGVRLT